MVDWNGIGGLEVARVLTTETMVVAKLPHRLKIAENPTRSSAAVAMTATT